LQKKLITACVLGGLIVGSFFLGREIGRDNSPDYGKESSALIFLMTHMQIVSSDKTDIRLALPAGLYTYEYTLSNNSVTRTTRPASEIADLPMKKRWALLEDNRITEFFGIMTTVPAAAGVLSKLSATTDRLSVGARMMFYVAGAAALATGGIVGYFTTYDDTADYDNETFRKTLLDANSWAGTAHLIVQCAQVKMLARIRSEVASTTDIKKQATESSKQNEPNFANSEDRCEKFDIWLREHL
jgi:hypothetical protein